MHFSTAKLFPAAMPYYRALSASSVSELALGKGEGEGREGEGREGSDRQRHRQSEDAFDAWGHGPRQATRE